MKSETWSLKVGEERDEYTAPTYQISIDAEEGFQLRTCESPRNNGWPHRVEASPTPRIRPSAQHRALGVIQSLGFSFLCPSFSRPEQANKLSIFPVEPGLLQPLSRAIFQAVSAMAHGFPALAKRITNIFPPRYTSYTHTGSPVV